MAKMKLSDSAFKLIAEGTHTFKVMEVDDSKYADFGKLVVKLQTAKGDTHLERFTFLNAKGELNEVTLRVWSYFARTCLNDFKADEIDTQDIVGCYITATVKHETSPGKGENAGKMYTNVRLNDYTPASGFGSSDEENYVALAEDIDDMDDDLDL